jgi:hypothetical protein
MNALSATAHDSRARLAKMQGLRGVSQPTAATRLAVIRARHMHGRRDRREMTQERSADARRDSPVENLDLLASRESIERCPQARQRRGDR